MRLLHHSLVYFGLREPTPEDEAWARSSRPPWWRMLTAAVIVTVLLGVLMWLLTDASLGEALVRVAVVAVAVTLVNIALERRRRTGDPGRAGPTD